MFRFGDEKGQLKCSFCGKSQEQVRKLIAAPGVYICDECVELCNEILEEEFGDSDQSDSPENFGSISASDIAQRQVVEGALWIPLHIYEKLGFKLGDRLRFQVGSETVSYHVSPDVTFED